MHEALEIEILRTKSYLRRQFDNVVAQGMVKHFDKKLYDEAREAAVEEITEHLYGDAMRNL